MTWYNKISDLDLVISLEFTEKGKYIYLALTCGLSVPVFDYLIYEK